MANLSRRFNWVLQGYSQTQFYYGQLGGVFYDPAFGRHHRSRTRGRDADDARRHRLRRSIRSTAFARMELSGGVTSTSRSSPIGTQATPQRYQEAGLRTAAVQQRLTDAARRGVRQETTVFREFGPLAGSTMRLAYEVAPKLGNSLSRQTMDRDPRKYMRFGGSGLLALRARGYKSWGRAPKFIYFGGNRELRGYELPPFTARTRLP